MLVKASVVRQCQATRGDTSIGDVVDMYFDEAGWRSCYLVIETGSLFSGKRSLVPLSYLERADWIARRLALRITEAGLQSVGCNDLDKNVASQLEKHGAGYVAWPPPAHKPEGSTAQVPLGDPNDPGTDDVGKPLLRSAKEVVGYAIEATDGPCGHIDDLLIDDATWRIEFLLVNPRNFLPGTPRAVPAPWVEACDWLSHSMRMNVDRDRIRECPTYETSSTVDHLINSV